MTKEELHKKLLLKNEAYKNGEFEIISDESINSKFIMKTKYGICNINIGDLYHNRKLKIKTAFDKTEFWIKRNKDVRKDYFDIDYSNVVYMDNSNKVKLRCKIHDYTYHQRPSHHTAGVQGCIHCMNQTIMYTEQNLQSHKEFFKNFDSYLYVINLTSENENFYKVGITSDKRFDYRMNSLKKIYNVEVIYKEKNKINQNYLLEQKFLHEFKKFKYKPLKHFTGHTECLTINPIEAYYYYYKN